MRVLIHDFAGHPFQVQLSRELASRGHSLMHVTAAGLPGPKGRLRRGLSDPPGLVIQDLALSGLFQKYSPWRRLVAQRQYALDLLRLSAEFRPDVVLSGNTPSDIQARLLKYCRRHRVGSVHWVQDVYSQALEFVVRPKLGPISAVAVEPFRRLDRYVARNSDEVIAISPGFVPLFIKWGVCAERLTVIENWAPLDEMPLRSKPDGWRQTQGLNGEPIFMYSGTLGLKHRPDLIYALARELTGQARVVVVSEGIGRQYLESQRALPNLTLLDFQPYAQVPEVLASADVLLATLEAGAGEFAVPSKVLTYLCAGRPILLGAPLKNLASKVVARSGGGVVVSPDDSDGWLQAARTLAGNGALRDRLGCSARRYAESMFDIAKITDRFEVVLASAWERAVPHGHKRGETSSTAYLPAAARVVSRPRASAAPIPEPSARVVDPVGVVADFMRARDYE